MGRGYSLSGSGAEHFREVREFKFSHFGRIHLIFCQGLVLNVVAHFFFFFFLPSHAENVLV